LGYNWFATQTIIVGTPSAGVRKDTSIMRIRAILASSAVVMATTIALGLATTTASAATLYTDGGHATQVAVGGTFGATATSPFVMTSATSTLFSCNGGSTQSLRLNQNSGGTVIATFTAGTVAGCSPLGWTGLYATPWTLTITGSPTIVGDTRFWSSAITNLAFSLAGAGNYSGNLTTGVTARQTGLGGGVCLIFNDAGTFSGSLTSNGRLDTSYCFEGAASMYSLT
jgi:hypothetical protein